jgi:myb proto-oncogene protein
LRNSARTFKNTPSIIRKRALRGAAIAKISDVTCTPSSKFSCPDDFQIVDSTNSPNEKQGFLRYFQPETSFAIKSLKRHFDYAFDMEKEADLGKCGKSVSLSEPLHQNFLESR